MSSRRLEAVARAISEGHPVDWESLERQSDAGDVRRLRHLRTLDAFARASSGSAVEPRTSTDALPYRWVWRIVVAVALAQGILAFARFAWSFTNGAPPFPVVLQGSSIATLLICAAALVRTGTDGRALNLAGLLAALAASGSQPFLSVYRGTPLHPFASGMYPDAFLPFFAWSFVRDFPRILRFSRLDTICAVAAAISCAAGLVLAGANLAIYHAPALAATVGASALDSRGTTLYWAIVCALLLPALGMMLLRIRLADPAERRRVALFLGGLGAGILPVVSIVSLDVVSERFNALTDRPEIFALASAIIYASVLSVPFTTTYAVLVQRVLTVRLVIRNTLRYALARQTLLVMTVLPLAALGWWIFSNRTQTIAELFTRVEAATALGLAGTAVLLLASRTHLLRALDRRYFRQDVDLTAELARLADALAEARDARHAAEIVEAAIARALQVDRVDVFRDAGLELVPVRGRGQPLPRDSALAALMEASSDAADLAGSGLGRLLPREEQAWLAANGVFAIAPMVREDALVGFISVGARRNDLEFPPEALAFLTTAASSTSLAMGRARSGSSIDSAPGRLAEPAGDTHAAECESCAAVMAASATSCPCGGRLRAAALPLVLAGKFQVDARLGAGGMGVVYRARDLSLGRPVALKTLPRLTRAAIDRLNAEAQSMARTAHPALATIHAIETWDRAPVLVIELLEGGTLAERIRSGALPAREAVLIAVQLASSLAHLHRQGMLHRDIKPGNIGFTAGRQLKLLDFGLAAALQEPAEVADQPDAQTASATRTIAGTPLYLPPEAWQHAQPAPSWDVWGAAVVLYEMLAGQHPLAHAGSLGQAVSLLRQGKLADARRLPADVPAAVARFATEALAFDPVSRPASAEAFAAGLAATMPEDPTVQAHVLMLRGGGFDV